DGWDVSNSPDRSKAAGRDLSAVLILPGRSFEGVGGEPFLHSRLGAVLAHLLEPHRVNARILILVFDLVAALLDAGRDRAPGAGAGGAGRAALHGGQRIAQAADAGREIARRPVAGVEVLVELAFGRRKHHAVLPVDAQEVLVA